jgi:hypothetical protein
MTILRKLELFKEELEKEYKANAIRVIILFDENIGLLSVGIEHPLYPSFLCDMRWLKKGRIEITLRELCEQFRHDLDMINERLRSEYEHTE